MEIPLAPSSTKVHYDNCAGMWANFLSFSHFRLFKDTYCLLGPGPTTIDLVPSQRPMNFYDLANGSQIEHGPREGNIL